MLELMGPVSGGTVMFYAVGRGLALLPLFKEKEAHAYGRACPALRPRNDTFWLPKPMLIWSFIMECGLNETLSTRISCVDRLSRGFLRAFQVLPTACLQPCSFVILLSKHRNQCLMPHIWLHRHIRLFLAFLLREGNFLIDSSS